MEVCQILHRRMEDVYNSAQIIESLWIINLHVIASQCAHWRGNPLQRSAQNHKRYISETFRGLPRRFAPRNDNGVYAAHYIIDCVSSNR